MLYVEQNGTIRLTRGDTARLIVPIENEVTHQSYDMLSTDILKFTIKKTVKDYLPLVQKVITGSNVFNIKKDSLWIVVCFFETIYIDILIFADSLSFLVHGNYIIFI